MTTKESGTRVRVWDIPVRLFHWLLAPLVAFAWWSAETGHLEWHRLAGYATLALLLFRLVWGLVGSDTARFAQFLRGPSAIVAYLRGRLVVRGHNPLGGWSVFAMLLLLVAEVVLGLFAVDVDGIESGPLSVFVSFDQGRLAAEAHHLVFNAILALVALHLAAILFHAVVKRDNLVGPMITGAKRADAASLPAVKMAPLWLAMILIALAAGVAYAVAHAFWLT